MIATREARRDDDLDAINVGNPFWGTAELAWAQLDGAPPDMPAAMVVAERDGRLVGSAFVVGAGVCDGHRGMVNVWVPPDERRRGAGRELWNASLAVATPERVPGVLTGADDDDPDSLAVAVAAGLRPAGLHLESDLDLTSVDREPAAPDGIELRPVVDDDAGWHEAWRLLTRLWQDAPDAAEGTEDMPYGVFRAMVAEPWQLLLAWDGAEPVGVTCVSVRTPAAGRLNTLLTAVAATHRGRGLATALKTAHALQLAASGWRCLTTQNTEGNAPILAANRRLGFVPGARLRDLVFDYPPS